MIGAVVADWPTQQVDTIVQVLTGRLCFNNRVRRGGGRQQVGKLQGQKKISPPKTTKKKRKERRKKLPKTVPTVQYTLSQAGERTCHLDRLGMLYLHTKLNS